MATWAFHVKSTQPLEWIDWTNKFLIHYFSQSVALPVKHTFNLKSKCFCFAVQNLEVQEGWKGRGQGHRIVTSTRRVGDYDPKPFENHLVSLFFRNYWTSGHAAFSSLNSNIESSITFVAKCWHVFRLFGLYIVKSGPVVLAFAALDWKCLTLLKIFHVVRFDWSHVGTDWSY